MELKRNPFRYGADFGPDDIVGRSDEITHVESVIRDSQKLFFAGPRGFGKTSILRAAQASLSRSGAIVLYVNAETSVDVGKLVGISLPPLRLNCTTMLRTAFSKLACSFSHSSRRKQHISQFIRI